MALVSRRPHHHLAHSLGRVLNTRVESAILEYDPCLRTQALFIILTGVSTPYVIPLPIAYRSSDELAIAVSRLEGQHPELFI